MGLLLQIFNQYAGTARTLSFTEAAAYVARVPVMPIPERLALDDWRAHVPMPLLEGWAKLSDQERLALYVMAQSATHPFEFMSSLDEPVLN
jgi:hypothetical protein